MNGATFWELDGTPYVVNDDDTVLSRFLKVRETCRRSSEIAIRAQARIVKQAGNLFPQFSSALRANIVAESNRIEGYDWSPDTVAEVVRVRRELLSLPVRSFVNGVQSDSRVYEALGLYRAHQLADEWASNGEIPGESDIRSFHSLVAIGEWRAGRYKVAENSIEGSDLKTCPPWDVSRAMAQLVSWWRSSVDCEPVLAATVVHAWITQIHPFEDGNGRVARLLANLALSQREYPPLVLRSDSDRNQYLDALARCDDGDILPLYELFSRVIRRQVGIMGGHDYVRMVVEGRLLSDVRLAADIWRGRAMAFMESLGDFLSSAGWQVKHDGYPEEGGFDLLLKGKPEGASWCARCGPRHDNAAILLWWGFQSVQFRGAAGDSKRMYPSLYVSTRFGSLEHPYEKELIFNLEIQIRPFVSLPVYIMSGGMLASKTMIDGAKIVCEKIKYIYDGGFEHSARGED